MEAGWLLPLSACACTLRNGQDPTAAASRILRGVATARAAPRPESLRRTGLARAQFRFPSSRPRVRSGVVLSRSWMCACTECVRADRTPPYGWRRGRPRRYIEDRNVASSTAP